MLTLCSWSFVKFDIQLMWIWLKTDLVFISLQKRRFNLCPAIKLKNIRIWCFCSILPSLYVKHWKYWHPAQNSSKRHRPFFTCTVWSPDLPFNACLTFLKCTIKTPKSPQRFQACIHQFLSKQFKVKTNLYLKSKGGCNVYRSLLVWHIGKKQSTQWLTQTSAEGNVRKQVLLFLFSLRLQPFPSFMRPNRIRE